MDSRPRIGLAPEALECRRPLAVGAAGIPAAPTGLSAAAVSASEIGLVWELGDAADTAVVIERRAGADGQFATLAVLPAGETIYTDTGCWAGTTYAYRVKARGPGGDSGWSPVQSATCLAVGAGAYTTVTDVAVTPTSATTATMSFTNPNPAGVSYLVERSANGLAYQVVASIGTGTRWEDTGLDPAGTYWYRVRGTGWERATSDYSAPVRVTLPGRAAAVPIEPGSVTADAVSATAVRVSWAPRDPSPAAYVIERSVDYDPWHPVTWARVATTAVGATSFVDTGLAAETPYVYRVRATRGGVESAAGRLAATVMRVLFGDGVGVVTASAGTGSAKTYDIGPGRPLARLADLDWSRLGPGDTVNIHFKPGGYHELIQIASRGTAAAWITVNGIPDPATGALPIIDAADAVLAPQFRNHWEGLHGFGAIVVGTRPGFAPGYKPGYIAIRGLDVRNCSIGNSFTDVDGTQKAYGNVGAGVYLERCDHVTISGCTIHDNGEGIFGAGQSTFDRLMTKIVVDSNHIFGNGNVGSEREHNTYIEAVGTTYQFNRYGPLRAGALGAGLKDRSAGTVIRGNWIEGGLHQLQIPEAQNQADLAVALPQYRVTIVQGNALVAPPGNGASPVWFGGDQGLPAWYRKGVLYVHHNTIVARSNQAQNWKTTAIVAASGAEAIDVRNTIIATIPDTSGATPADLGLVGTDNRASFSRTWVSPGWRPTTVGDYTFTGQLGGTAGLFVGAAVDPGFVNLVAGDYRLAAGSTCVDAAGRLPGSVAAWPLTSQFRSPAGSAPRVVVGAAADLGAFEVGMFSITPTNASRPEGNLGLTPLTFTVTRTGDPSLPASVRFTVTGTGAQPANKDDFGGSLPGGTVSFAAGVTSRTITVNASGDSMPELDETFSVTLSNPVGAVVGAARAAVGTIRDDDILTAAPQILLTADTLTRLRRMAAANTPQWQAFRGRLDANLDVVIADDSGAYQGSELTSITDYALGYQVLKVSDPLTAARYADKALGLLRSGLRDYQKGSWVARQFLARGDGTTRSFVLPNTNVHAGTLAAYLSAVTTYPVVHGAAGGRDDVAYYQKFLKVSATSDGAAGYAQGVDWRQFGESRNDQIDWSPAGREPAVGSRYYVTATSGAEAAATRDFTFDGTRITFTRAPRVDQAVFVQYIHGRSSADGSTLDYQQTSAGDGGFNSIFVDDTYTSRYLGANIAIGLDWLDGYAGFRPTLKQAAVTMLARWADWLRTPNADAFGGYNGYFYTSPLSNYGAGSYLSLAMTGLALGPRTADGPRLLTAAVAYRNQYVLPALQNPTDSAKGGSWSEGWNYGHNAVQHLLLAARALESAGRITATAERRWADELVDSLAAEQSAPGLVYDGGDVYQYPFRLMDKALFYSLADMAASATKRANANWVLQRYPDSAFLDPADTGDFRDLLFRDPSAAAAFWSDQPLQRLATGTGLVTARSDWSATPTWLSLQMGNLLAADHQNYAPGQLQISRGSDRLLVNACQVNHVYGDDSSGLRSLSQFGNIVAVDDRGALDQYGQRLQDTPFCMGVDYGSPGVVVTGFEGTADYVYAGGDYHAAYSYADAPGAGGPASALTRQLVYLRPGVILVHDRVTTTRPEYDKQLRWNFDVAPAVSGNGFVATVGTSRLFGRTFSASPLATSAARVTIVGSDPAVDTFRVTTRNTDTAASVAFLTVFQVAAATTSSMDATASVVSADGRMEGARVGDQLVLFGRNGAVDPATPISYGLTGTTAVAHVLANLQAGRTYQITADGVPTATVVASGAGVLTFRTPPGTRSVRVTG